jgi:lambda repressor-like predicted transcriptional regulator
MDYTDFHPEDVKAAIRKRFGSLAKFEREHGLPPESVYNLLRGLKSRRVAAVVNAIVLMEASSIALTLNGIPNNNRKKRIAHRSNAQAA